MSAGAGVVIPEIVDYEIRRELLRLKKLRAVAKLDALSATPGRYLPLTTAAMRLAAELWADVRRRGQPTADPHALDVDVILAAQAIGTGVALSSLVVATTNVSHLSHFVPARLWSDI